MWFVRSYKRAPFFILDEIDANLDKFNVQKVVNYWLIERSFTVGIRDTIANRMRRLTSHSPINGARWSDGSLWWPWLCGVVGLHDAVP